MPSICVALGENSYPIMVDHNVLVVWFWKALEMPDSIPS